MSVKNIPPVPLDGRKVFNEQINLSFQRFNLFKVGNFPTVQFTFKLTRFTGQGVDYLLSGRFPEKMGFLRGKPDFFKMPFAAPLPPI